MFRKPFTTGNSHLVSGADRKKLRRSLEKVSGSTEEVTEQLLPSKAGEVEAIKVQGSKAVIYVLDGVPIMLDVSGKGDYAPSCFGLWRAPDLLPQVFLKHPAVSQYVTKGADLMLPGVDMSSGLPQFEEGDLISICVHGNPAPIAVGSAAMSSKDAAMRRDGKGRLLELIQYYGDELWATLGAKAVPNPGFQGPIVVPLNMVGVTLEQLLNGEAPGSAAEPAGGPGESTAEAAGHLLTGLEISSAGDTPEGSKGGSSEAAAPSDCSPGPAASVAQLPEEDPEVLLERVLLQALHRSIQDEDLPLNSSVLWNQHMLVVKPPGVVLDIKKSKHKKMSKFLQGYGKAGLLTLKEDKHSGDTILTAINRKHAKYIEYQPYKSSAAAEGTAGAAGPSGPSSSSSGAAAASTCVVEEVFKPGKDLKAVFEALGLALDGLYSAQECGEIAFSYVAHAQLEKGAPDNATIVLDAALCDALFKGVVNVKRGERYPTHLAKAQLRDSFMSRCAQQTRVTRGGESAVRKGTAPCLQVSADKRGGKKITRIVGLEAFLVDPEQVAQATKSLFSCSTTVDELPGKGAGHEVVLQGTVVDGVADYLVKAYGIPKKYVQTKQ